MINLLEVFIPTLNEEHRLQACVASLRRQLLPPGISLSVAIVDAGSTDRTQEIARSLGIPVLDNSKLKDPEAAKMIGFRAARGEYLLFMDADMQCAHPKTLSSMLEPLLGDSTLAAAFGRYVPLPGDVAINRALSMNPLQCDPVYQALVPEMPRTAGVKRYQPLDVPPIAGTTMYRRPILASSLPFIDRYFDVDAPIHLISKGYDRFYYADSAEFVHGHIGSLKALVKKRLRNLDNGSGNGLLTKQAVPRAYTWVSPKRFGRLGLTLRLLKAASGVCLLPEALSMAVRFRDVAALLWPVMGPTVAFTLAYGVLRSQAGKRYLHLALRKSAEY